jgi:anthranilate synthase/phosphoribosyltransferase
MDEVSLHAPTLVAELREGEIQSYQLEAEDFGLVPYRRKRWQAAHRKKTVTF